MAELDREVALSMVKSALETAHDAVQSDRHGQHVDAEQSYRRVVALLAGVGAMLPPAARERAERLVHTYEERLSAAVFGQPGQDAVAMPPSSPSTPQVPTFHEIKELTPQAAARAHNADPVPAQRLRRPYWLLRALRRSMLSGAYIGCVHAPRELWRQSGVFRGLAARRAVLHRTLLALEQFRCNTDTQTLRASASAGASVSTNASNGTLNVRAGVHGVRCATSSAGEDDRNAVRVLLQALARLDSCLRQVRRDASRAFPSAVASSCASASVSVGAGVSDKLAPQDQDVPVFSPEDSTLSPPPQVAEPGLSFTFAGELSSAAASLGRRVTRARQGALAVAERAAASVPTHATTAELEQFVQLAVAVTDATDVLDACVVAQAAGDDASPHVIGVTSTSRPENSDSGGVMLEKALQLLFSGRKPGIDISPAAAEEQKQARAALTSISAFFGDVVCTLLLHHFDVLLSRYLQEQYKAFVRPLAGALTAASVAAAATATDLPPSADMQPDITVGTFDFD